MLDDKKGFNPIFTSGRGGGGHHYPPRFNRMWIFWHILFKNLEKLFDQIFFDQNIFGGNIFFANFFSPKIFTSGRGRVITTPQGLTLCEFLTKFFLTRICLEITFFCKKIFRQNFFLAKLFFRQIFFPQFFSLNFFSTEFSFT